MYDKWKNRYYFKIIIRNHTDATRSRRTPNARHQPTSNLWPFRNNNNIYNSKISGGNEGQASEGLHKRKRENRPPDNLND